MQKLRRDAWTYSAPSGRIPQVANPKPETRNSEPETRNPKPETRNPKSETRYPKHPNRKLRGLHKPAYRTRQVLYQLEPESGREPPWSRAEGKS